MAEPDAGLDIDKELTELNILSILNDKDWRDESTQEDNWRKPEDGKNSNVRWGGYSIHDENQQFNSSLLLENKINQPIDSRKAAPQFKLRF